MEVPSLFQKPKEEAVAFGIKVESAPSTIQDSMEVLWKPPPPLLHQFILKGLPAK